MDFTKRITKPITLRHHPNYTIMNGDKLSNWIITKKAHDNVDEKVMK